MICSEVSLLQEVAVLPQPMKRSSQRILLACSSTFLRHTEGMLDQLQGIEGRPTNFAVLHSHLLMPDNTTFRRITGVLNALLADVLSLCPLACQQLWRIWARSRRSPINRSDE